MFQKEAFGSTSAQEKLATLQGDFVFPESESISEVNDILEKVRFSLQIHGEAPKYVLTRSMYDNGDGETLQSARFVVRPAVSHVLKHEDLKKTFTINAGADFFDKFIQEMAVWFDVYQYNAQLQVNTDALNEVVSAIIIENEIPFTVEFANGEGLIDATDTHAVIGISPAVIEGLSELPLFDENMESRREGYKARILETLKEVTKPYEIVKVKSNVTRDLGIYSRRALNKLVRQFVSRNADFVRVGVGYVDKENYFAVVEKVAVTEEELANLDVTNAVVLDNADASAKEKEAGKTKIVVTYRISPFLKENGIATDVALSEVI